MDNAYFKSDDPLMVFIKQNKYLNYGLWIFLSLWVLKGVDIIFHYNYLFFFFSDKEIMSQYWCLYDPDIITLCDRLLMYTGSDVVLLIFFYIPLYLIWWRLKGPNLTKVFIFFGGYVALLVAAWSLGYFLQRTDVLEAVGITAEMVWANGLWCTNGPEYLNVWHCNLASFYESVASAVVLNTVLPVYFAVWLVYGFVRSKPSSMA